MSKRKGLSVDEKRDRMLQYILKSKSLWTLKELEKILPKECGIVSQSVKDVLLSLEADGLVTSDKVGVKLLYWSFPSDTLVKLETRIGQLEESNQAKRRKVENLQKEEETLKKERVETPERSSQLEKLKELEEKNKTLKSQLEEISGYDPAAIDAKRNIFIC